jgi:hypothetical protein
MNNEVSALMRSKSELVLIGTKGALISSKRQVGPLKSNSEHHQIVLPVGESHNPYLKKENLTKRMLLNQPPPVRRRVRSSHESTFLIRGTPLPPEEATPTHCCGRADQHYTGLSAGSIHCHTLLF